ncbi:pseudouridine synthase [Globomyces pollinis-pini]|nr:pseudouridine synthase [Globomyces pollinis-pini]
MEEYEKLTKEELIEKLYKLENDQKQVEKKTSKRSKKIQKPFDFSNTRARHVALKVAYQGEKYFGFTGTIDDPIATIEKELFTALIKCKLIPAPDACGFARAGRTDKGVSGFGQVISLWVRSNLPKDSPLVLPWDEVKALKPSKEEIPETIDVNMDEDVKELSYISTLNRLLPKEIRILAWSPVSKTFDARYSCKWRKYKYLFPSKQLDIEKMKQAAALFIGTFDCRFICKLDPDKVDYPDFYTRTIYEAEIEKVNDDFSVFIVRV